VLTLQPAAFADTAASLRSREILLLVGSEAGTPPAVGFLTGLQAAMRTVRAVDRFPFVFYVEYLDRFRFADRANYDADLRAWLARKYAGRRVDVIVTAGVDALTFALESRGELWPGVPVVFGAIDDRRLGSLGAAPNVTGSTTHMDLAATINLALRLLPGTRHVALLGGSAPADTYWADVARKDLATFAGRLEIIDMVGLSWEQILARVRVLPADAILVTLSLVKDALGRTVDPLQGARLIAERANRPFFTAFGAVFGQGTVGGGIVSFEDAGRRTASMVERVLDGTPAGAIPIERNAGALTVVDARQLRRWRIPESRVPAGTEVRFPLPNLWRDHRQEVIAGSAALFTLSGLVAVLLVERRRRRRAETEARQRLVAMAHMNRSAAVGELSASLAHEINQPLGSILNNAEAAALMLARNPPAIPEALEAIEAICIDNRRASDIVRRLRALFRRHELDVQELSPNEAVRQAVELVDAAARERTIGITLDLAPHLPAVLGDGVYIQQVLLILLMNAMDALADAARPRGVAVATRLEGPSVVFTVTDGGRGFTPESSAGAFEPFYSTKPDGMGMGLSIAQTIVLAHGGHIWAANNADAPGATVGFAIPCAAAVPPGRAASPSPPDKELATVHG
jgi:signal transduction histidine kinase